MKGAGKRMPMCSIYKQHFSILKAARIVKCLNQTRMPSSYYSSTPEACLKCDEDSESGLQTGQAVQEAHALRTLCQGRHRGSVNPTHQAGRQGCGCPFLGGNPEQSAPKPTSQDTAAGASGPPPSSPLATQPSPEKPGLEGICSISK